jgi:CRP/FNR family transcriptional regulator, anaerobic regulatory protein
METSKISMLLDKNFPQFEQELKEIIAKNGSIKKFKANEMLIRSGEPMRSTMLVASGHIKLFTEGEEGEEFFMYYLEPGQACAMSMICASGSQKSDVEAYAIEESEIISLPIEMMGEMMSKYKTWYTFVIENYRSRFQELLDTLRSVAFNALDERLEYYLVKQKNAFNTSLLPLTHEQIANDLNSSRVVISRLLKQLEQKGRVKLHRNALELLK